MRFQLRSSAWAFALLVTSAASVAANQASNWAADLTPARKAVLDQIAPSAMKGHISFLASDLLEGRGTPSKGLDIAAEYIASQFRRAGLEPGGDGETYLQAVEVSVRGSEEKGKAYNVIGILRGSDPQLKGTYVIVSAHYDHLGKREGVEGDNIYNGANDDASGVACMLELASVFPKLETKPKRSIVYVAFCGEERGLVGSRFYAGRPTVPLAQTIANVNLEHMGRTDDNEGPRVGAACMTGFDYNDLGTIFARAGKAVGVEVSKHERFSDPFFSASDNLALAAKGVPANTLCTSFIFPDYHKPGDHWEKIDYENMTKVCKMVGLGVLMIADSPSVPKWNTSNPKTSQYHEAWKTLTGAGGSQANR